MKVIDLKAVTVFQNNEPILKNIDFQLAEDEIVYLIGKTGSGKSSFLKTLYGELPLEEGAGMVAEFDLKELKRSQIPFLRRKIMEHLIFFNFLIH